MSPHPNLLDRLAVRIYPRYLYPGQYCVTIATVNVAMIHRLPDVNLSWKIMDYLFLKKASYMKYLGLARNLNIRGEFGPMATILELLRPEVDDSKSPGKHASPGDLICITPYDRQFIAAAGEVDTSALQKLSDIIAPAPGN